MLVFMNDSLKVNATQDRTIMVRSPPNSYEITFIFSSLLCRSFINKIYISTEYMCHAMKSVYVEAFN